MAIIEQALDAAPRGGHRKLWLAARPVVRRSVCRLVANSVDLGEVLVVIADDGTVIAEVVQVLCPEVVVQARQPFVAVLVGEERMVVAAVLGSVEAYLATVAGGSFAVLTVPAAETPMVATVRVVDRRQLS